MTLSRALCVGCGASYEPGFAESTKAATHLCFSCDFWRRQLELDELDVEENNPLCGFVSLGGDFEPEGTHFRIGTGSSPFRGYGGATFHIVTQDGVILRTNNLWCQGIVPQELRSDFPRTAWVFQSHAAAQQFLHSTHTTQDNG